MSLLRIALYLSFSSQGNKAGNLWDAFGLGVRFDLRYVCILGALLLISGLIGPLNPFRRTAGRSWFRFLCGLAAFLLVFFYAVDFAHYSYLSQRLSASVLNYLSDAGISVTMVWQTYPVLRIILILFVGTWLIARLTKWVFKHVGRDEYEVFSVGRSTQGNADGGPAGIANDGGQHGGSAGVGGVKSVRPRWWFLWFVGMFLLLGLGIFGRVGQYPLRWSDAFSLGSDYKANLSLNPFQSFFSSMKFRHSSYDAAKVKAAMPVLAPYFGFNGTDYERNVPVRAGAVTTKPNVVVVICESFSGYKSSMWGNPLNTTPFFDSLCGKGVFFDHCFTPSYGTARGVWAVITGIPDVEVSTTTSSRNPSAVDQHTIINDFAGYEKFYFLGGSTSWANIRGLLTNNITGLHLYEEQNYSAPKVDVWGISDKNLFLEANKVLKQQAGAPFFAIIQTADNHRPYTIPAEDKEAFHSITVSDDSLRKCGFATNDEMNAFRYTDFGYRTFIEAAMKEKYFENTIFLFVGDHGIPGDAGAMLPRAWTDQRLTAEHVPLLIYAPKLLSGRRIATNCSQVDVLPTLAGLSDIPYRNSTLGRDLLDSAHINGKEMSFIYDPDQGYVGVVKGDYFYRRQIRTGKEEIVSVVGNAPVGNDVLHGAEGKEMGALSVGLYETSKYMILKNKKK